MQYTELPQYTNLMKYTHLYFVIRCNELLITLRAKKCPLKFIQQFAHISSAQFDTSLNRFICYIIHISLQFEAISFPSTSLHYAIKHIYDKGHDLIISSSPKPPPPKENHCLFHHCKNTISSTKSPPPNNHLSSCV